MAGRKYTPQQRMVACASCGDNFTYTYTTGTPALHCSKKCRNRHKATLKALREMSLPACSIGGCDGKATRIGFAMCEKHYTRMRRTGLVERPAPPPSMQSHGYMLERCAHPLAVKGGVYQHRRVAYDMHGGVCPPCHWCGAGTSWGDCHIDHLNGRKADNREQNLVVSCARCNRARGAAWPFLCALLPGRLDQIAELVGEG